MALSSRRTQSLRHKFSALDKNGDRKLSFDEVKESLRCTYMGRGIEELKACFKDADKNDDGYLSFREYLDLLHVKADGTCSQPREDDQSTEAPSDGDIDENGDRVHDGEDFDHWVHRVEGVRRRSSVCVSLISTHEIPPSIESGCARPKVEKNRSFPDVLPPLNARPLSSRRASDCLPSTQGSERPLSSRRASDRLPRTQQGSDRKQSRGPERLFYERSTCTRMQSQRAPVHPKARKMGTPTFRQRHENLSLNAILGNCESTVANGNHDTRS